MTKKEIAQDFLTLASSGQPGKAFELYIADNFIHHNAYFKGDRQTLMLAMEEAHNQNPNKVFEMQRALEDGNLVAVHSRVQTAGENGWEGAVIHIFRFDDNNKVVELGDFGQSIPEEQINENGMF
jgi:predicted SnoaL-like aldol condensation-catalyzing enzyme